MTDQHAESVATVGSLFSGIGGIDLGLERAGFRVIWQAETDPYASKVLAKHWPNVPNLGDVTAIDWRSVERPDVLAGGFPCQPVSRAGRRLAQADDRWLWPAFLGAIRSLRPDHVLLENVPGLLVHAMGDVLGDLASIGYDAEWESLPAAAFGAPHLRWRVFVVAYPGSQQHEGSRPADERTTTQELLVDSGCGRHGSPDEAIRPRWRSPQPSSWWESEPALDRVAHGIPRRVDRLRCLGNAVVPQVAEYVAAHVNGCQSQENG